MQSRVAFASVGSSTAGPPTTVAAGKLFPRKALTESARRSPLQWIAGQGWSVAALHLFLDVAAWMAVFQMIVMVRPRAFATTPDQYLVINLLQLVVIGFALYIIGGYDRKIDPRTLTYATEHILAIAGAAALSALLIYAVTSYDQAMKPSRGVMLLSFLLFLPISLLNRRALGKQLATTFANETFLVIGNGRPVVRFYESYKNSPNRQQLRFVDLGSQRVGLPIAGEGSPIVEGDLADQLENLSPSCSGIILAERVQSLGAELLESLVRTQFQKVRVYTLESFYETHWRRLPLDMISSVWPLQSGFQLARISPYHYLKRSIDLVGAAVALAVCAPLFALIPLLIWLEGGGPIVFRQQRMGLAGKPFTIFKFRTMEVCADEATEDLYTRTNDQRVTRLGRWLRQLRLDELPQLVNVLRGEMSLIGPRAEWIKCTERYERAIPFYHFRHLVRPGITGWAQVNFRYGEGNADAIENLQYDLYYIRRYSIKLDAMIVLKTIYVMLFAKGR